MMNLAHDLFLLMFNLSQVHDNEKIIGLFTEGMQEIFRPATFSFVETVKKESASVFEIRTVKSRFGFVSVTLPEPVEENHEALINNAVQMLAVMLERLFFEQRLEKERDNFESIAKLKLGELNNTVAELEKARTASINLIEDLTLEIGKRKIAEESIRESEAFLSNLLNTIPIPVFYKDINGKYIDANDAFVTLFGYSREQLSGKTVFELYPHDLARIYFEKDVELLKKSGTQVYESKIVDVNGLEHNVIFHKASFRNNGNESAGLIGAVLDITHLKKAEETLKSLSARDEAILESVPDIIMEVDNSKCYSWANKSGYEFFGDDVIGREASFYFVGAQDTYEKVDTLFDGTGNKIYIESWQRRKDGEKRLLAWWCKVLKDEYGGVTGVLSSASDITELRLSIESLQQSEKKFRNLFHKSPLGKSMTGIDGSMYANQRLCEILGYTGKELESTNWKAITHPADIELTKRIIKMLLDGEEENCRFEKRYVHRNGSIVWADVSSYLERDREGTPLYFITTVNDITERKNLERERFKLLDMVDHSLNEVYLFDSESLKFEYVNHGALINTGYSFDEMKNLTPVDLQPDYTENSFRVLIQPLLSGEKEALIFETIHRRKDGIIYPVEVHLQVYREGDKNLLFSVIIDISVRKKAENEIKMLNEELEQRVIDRTRKLEISQKNYKEIFEMSPVSIWKEDWSGVISAVVKLKQEGVTDFRAYFETHPEFIRSSLLEVRILDVNPATLVLFGAESKEQMLESLAAVFSTPDVLPGFVEELFALCSGLTVFETDMGIRTLNQEMIHVLLRMVFPPHDSDSGIVLTNMTDITLRKRITEDLEKSKLQLLEANKELEAFSYSVSHDLRAPLRSVHSFTGILKEDYGEVLDSEGKRICGIIESSSIRMGQLIDDLLAFSRVGRSGLNYFRIGMGQLAKSVYQELTTPDDRQRISFSIRKLPPAFGDAALIKQVMSNLIANAIKYTMKKEKPEITVGSYQEGDEIVYYVKDNGVGFDMKYVNKLFGVFQRLHSTSEFEGNGVGLAIVQRIVLRHGGRVWAEGEIEKGATFYFSIPGQRKL